jgi:hypothetical protein
MASIERLPGAMNPDNPWPDGLTLHENLVDLGWHGREFTLGHSHAWTVVAGERMVAAAIFTPPTVRAAMQWLSGGYARARRCFTELRVIPLVFMEDKPEGPKIVSFHASARGAMARFVLEHRLTDPAALRDFDRGGYVWQADLSTPPRPVFLRRAETQASSAAA